MVNKISIFLSLFLLLLLGTLASAQIDSVGFSNGDIIVGEVKSLDKGVLKIETDYSDSDFLIEWKQIAWIRTQTHFQIYLKDGVRYYSNLYSLNDSICKVVSDQNQFLTCRMSEIVFLNKFEDRFLDRLNAEIEFGLDIAKSQNSKSFTTRSSLGYQAEKWSTDISLNTYKSTRDSTTTIQRNDAEYNFRYYFLRKWYAIYSSTALTNTEQKLDLRVNNQIGLGLFIIRTNSAYWGAKLGYNRNIEKYTSDSIARGSWEGYLGTEINLYDMGDLSIQFSATVYPGITEWGRWRSDSKFDIKYDLPLDFYIKLGASLNYDNQPAAGASEWDYVLSASFGWEW